jgi:phosphatidylserine/phosphatidylglycerophosphate/cardiolipin synthase-like enzyme
VLTCALGPDSAGTLLTATLRRARRSIDVAVYEMGPSYAWVVAAAAKRGVRVRLLLDAHATDGNDSTASAVLRNGGECRVLGGGAPAAHWKMLIVDGGEVAVGTGNLVWRDAPRDRHGLLPPAATPLHGTREWWAISERAPGLALAARRAFDVAWQQARRPPRSWETQPHATPGDVGAPVPQVPPLTAAVDGARLRLVVGGLPVALATGRLIHRARRRALITAPYVHPRAAGVRWLMAAARQAQARGVDVRVLLGDRPQARDAAWLRTHGVPARWMDAERSTRGHAKGLIVDDTAVITSANWSTAGFGRNWEAGMIAGSAAVAAYYADAWQRDWTVAEPL